MEKDLVFKKKKKLADQLLLNSIQVIRLAGIIS